MRINRGIRQQLLAASLGVSLLQPAALGAVGSVLLGAAAGEVKAQQTVNTEAIGRIAQAITVRIEGATQGSGVLVKREGNRYTVLTAWHVVSGQRPGEELDVYTPDGQRHPVAKGTIQRVGDVDMATLSFQSNNVYQVANIESKSSVTLGEPTIVAGFPRAKQGSILVSNGVVVANADIGIDNGYQLIYTSQTEPGMSGGPVLDSRGNVVAIHGRGELDSFISELTSRAIKTGANQGVPIKHLLAGTSGQTIDENVKQPQTADDYIALARSLFESADFYRNIAAQSTVMKLLNKIIELKPTSEGYLYRGALKADSKDFQGSLADFRMAQKLDPDNHKVAQSLSKVYFAIGRKDDAIANLVGYLERNIGTLQADARWLLEDLEQMGEKVQSLILLDKAISTSPKNPALLGLRAIAKMKNDDYKGAINDFRESVKHGDPGLYDYEIMKLMEKTEGPMGAVNHYTRMISKSPMNEYNYYFRATARKEAGDMNGFYQDMIKSFQLSAKKSSDYVSLAKATQKMGDKAGALKELDTALKLLTKELASGELDASSAGSVYTRISSAQEEIGDTQAALYTLDLMIKQFPQDSFGFSARGSLRKNKLNDHRGALEDYKTAAKLSNYDSIDVSNWAQEATMPFYENWNKQYLISAIRIYDEAITHNPREGFHYFGRAELKARIGDLLGALDDMNKTVAIDNRYYKERAKILLQLSRNSEASADLDRALALVDSTSWLDFYSIAELLHTRLGQTRKALDVLNKGINGATLDVFYDIMYSLRAAIKLAMGDITGACADHRMAISINRENSESNEWLKSREAANCR
jgi:tetratricopeptide (TPR) repeat protein